MTVRWPTLRPWLLRLGVLAAALGLWQGLSASGVLSPDEFPSMTSTAALWHQAAGSALWAALEQPASLETLADVLSQSFEVAWDEARQDAGAFVQEMQAAGLLSAVSS